MTIFVLRAFLGMRHIKTRLVTPRIGIKDKHRFFAHKFCIVGKQQKTE